jgi:predicted acylesterase/phospholipase RssA
MPPDVREWDRFGVLTFQGGGVYGLTLLGQLAAIHYDLKLVPVALAGTSAGAIVATLYWAGLTPAEIRDFFVTLANKKELLDLLGPFEPLSDPFTFEQLRELESQLKPALRDIHYAMKRRPGGIRSCWARFKAIQKAREPIAKVYEHFENRGIFRGENLESKLDSIIRSSSKLVRLKARLPSTGLLKFGDIRKLEDDPQGIFPPLFLTSTNLTQREMRVFSSIDSDCDDIPIARAARISGGFPYFFRPVNLTNPPHDDWYVDGGVVANFPMWIFGRDFREKLSKSPTFGVIARNPWLHIGLRRGPEDFVPQDLKDPFNFVKALVGMLTGGSRDELEYALAEIVRGARIIEQPLSQTAGPQNVLDLDKLDGPRVAEMVKQGSDFAKQRFADINFLLPKGRDEEEIQKLLDELVAKCEALFGSNNAKLRSNIFLPSGDRWFMRYGSKSVNRADIDQVNLPISGGQTGFCYWTGEPMICNLGILGEFAKAKPTEAEGLFQMTVAEHVEWATKFNWLVSAVIFDPYDFSSIERAPRKAKEANPSAKAEKAFYQSIDAKAPMLRYGVLNLDGRLEFDKLFLAPDAAKASTDPRIAAMIDLLQVCAFKLGQIFARTFSPTEPINAG